MLWSPSKNKAALATSSGLFILLVGCLSLDLLTASSFLNIPLASGVFVSVGATQFTLIIPANSPASDLVNPSTAPYADEIEA